MSSIVKQLEFTIDQHALTYPDCPICRYFIGNTINTNSSIIEDTTIYVRISCRKHYFHMECISKWLKRMSTCPLCNHNEDGTNMTL